MHINAYVLLFFPTFICLAIPRQFSFYVNHFNDFFPLIDFIQMLCATHWIGTGEAANSNT